MPEIGFGYGSEWHLLRWLGRHRDRLNEKIIAETGAESVRWVDFHFDSKKAQLDAEREGLDFLPADRPVRRAWARYWPQRGTQQNWDAVGLATVQGTDEWLLIEAKAHASELSSDCGADERGGACHKSANRSMISSALLVLRRHATGFEAITSSPTDWPSLTF
jgi:hypothetical protein